MMVAAQCTGFGGTGTRVLARSYSLFVRDVVLIAGYWIDVPVPTQMT
jgi:hypothetical protein